MKACDARTALRTEVEGSDFWLGRVLDRPSGSDHFGSLVEGAPRGAEVRHGRAARREDGPHRRGAVQDAVPASGPVAAALVRPAAARAGTYGATRLWHDPAVGRARPGGRLCVSGDTRRRQQAPGSWVCGATGVLWRGVVHR